MAEISDESVRLLASAISRLAYAAEKMADCGVSRGAGGSGPYYGGGGGGGAPRYDFTPINTPIDKGGAGG